MRKLLLTLLLVLGVALFLSSSTSVFALGKPSFVGSASGKLRACQARETAIKNRSDNLVRMANNMVDKFAVIAKRVEDYYTQKILPSRKTVPNYDSLVADIGTKKAAVQTALTKAQNDVAGFSCDSGNPKEQMTTFRKDMQGVIQKLKDYRVSIKDLIVAVHSVRGGENKEATKSGDKE